MSCAPHVFYRVVDGDARWRSAIGGEGRGEGCGQGGGEGGEGGGEGCGEGGEGGGEGGGHVREAKKVPGGEGCQGCQEVQEGQEIAGSPRTSPSERVNAVEAEPLLSRSSRKIATQSLLSKLPSKFNKYYGAN
jgi:hypothetical protein